MVKYLQQFAAFIWGDSRENRGEYPLLKSVYVKEKSEFRIRKLGNIQEQKFNSYTPGVTPRNKECLIHLKGEKSFL